MAVEVGSGRGRWLASLEICLTSQVTALTILGGLVSTGVGIWWGLRRGHHQGDQRDEDGPSS